MDYVPIMLNVSDRKVVIIGGGDAAYKKVRNLLNHERKITVIASDFDPRISSPGVEKIRMHIDDPGQVDDFLETGNIVIIATDNPELNGVLEEVCIKRHLLYNRVDEANSPFIFPASFESNGVIVSVSTLGRTPSLTRFMRDKIRERIEDLPPALPIVERLRHDCNIQDLKQKAEFFRNLFDSAEFWTMISQDMTERAYEFGLELSEKYQVKKNSPE